MNRKKGINKIMTFALVTLLCGFLINTAHANKNEPFPNMSSPVTQNARNWDFKNSAAAAASGPYLQWQTFLGGSGFDDAYGIAVDNTGNIYIVGTSNSSWGSPLNHHSGNNDAFVAKFNTGGILQWHTFLGGRADDIGTDIAIDAAGNIYVTGTSNSSWGNQLQSFVGYAFVAKLAADGSLQWHTFQGKSAKKIGVDNNENIYGLFYMGNKEMYGHEYKTFQIIKFDSNGNILNRVDSWTKGDLESMDVDRSGNQFVTGYAAYSTDSDIDLVVEVYNANGAIIWGNSTTDGWDTSGIDITADSSGSAYVTGVSDSIYWENPLTPKRPNSGGNDAFVAKFSKYYPYGKGVKWYTFLGGSEYDFGSAIAVDDKMNSYVVGFSQSSWGEPLRPFSGLKDVFVAQINANGKLLWHTFLGGNADDYGSDIAVDKLGNIYVVGTSSSSWGIPLSPFSGDSDIFLAKLNDSLGANLDLQAERREARAFSIARQYGQIQFLAGNGSEAVAQYRIMRRQGSGDFVLLRTVTPQELQNNQFQMQDKYLEKDITYTYRVEAYDTAGQLIGISSEKTI